MPEPNEPIENDGLDTFDLLSAEDVPEVKEEVKEEVKKEEPKKEEAKKEEEEEIEIEGEPELEDNEEEEELTEDIDLITPVRSKEILAKYPDVFKDFPYLKVAYFRDKQYTDILPTVNDAKEAVGRSQILGKFESELKQGSTEGILKAVKENDPAAFAKVVDEYLPSLQRVDPNAFYHIIGNMAKPIIHNMAQQAQATDNDDLRNAALVINRFLFGNDTLTPMQRYSKETPEKNKAEDEINQQRVEFYREKIEAVQTELDTKSSNALKSTIDLHIDPKGVMSDYVKRNAVRDCLAGVQALIAADKPFKTHLDNLWKRAAEDKLSRQAVDRIRIAYLSKAKAYLPAALQKARNEALRGLKSKETTRDKRGLIAPGKAATSSGNGSKNEMKQGENTLDFFMRD